MGLFKENLPEGYTIVERLDGFSKKTEFTIYFNGRQTSYTTYVRSHAVREAKARARLGYDK